MHQHEHTPLPRTAPCSLCARRPGVVPMLVAAQGGLASASLCEVCAARVAAPPGASAPSNDPDTVAGLSALRPGSEADHDVAITDEALEAAARLSDRCATEDRRPGRAIELIEQAATAVRLRAAGSVGGEARRLRTALIEVSAAKQAAVDAEAYEQAGELKTRADALRARLAGLGQPTDAAEQDRPVVGEADVAAVVASRTGIPVGELDRG